MASYRQFPRGCGSYPRFRPLWLASLISPMYHLRHYVPTRCADDAWVNRFYMAQILDHESYGRNDGLTKVPRFDLVDPPADAAHSTQARGWAVESDARTAGPGRGVCRMVGPLTLAGLRLFSGQLPLHCIADDFSVHTKSRSGESRHDILHDRAHVLHGRRTHFGDDRFRPGHNLTFVAGVGHVGFDQDDFRGLFVGHFLA